MPTIKRPDSVVTGAGNPPSGTASTPTLTGAGMAGPGPNVGAPSPTPTPTAAYVDGVGTSSISGLGPTLDDLRARVPGEPPRLGEFSRHRPLSESGIPDWGILKLQDASLSERGVVTSSHLPSELHPYYYNAPSPAKLSRVFLPEGADPETDPIFNSGVTGLAGAGTGTASCGGYTRDGDRVNTTAILTRSGVADGAVAASQEVTVSGMIYPADRGVLALLYWPPGGDVTDFLALPLLDRCVAALNLGQGVTPFVDASSGSCDGGPGVLSYTPEDASSFPGRYTGHYNLREICRGVDDLDGDPLNSPFDDLDGDSVAGCARVADADIPSPPQVRLGSSPDAGESPEEFGIPILGGDANAYASAPARIGATKVTSSNFFGYRLPVLDDYSEETGLKYTPRGEDGYGTRESARFFIPEAGNTVAGPYLSTAGNYSAYAADNVALQIARYRHTFYLRSTELLGDTEDAGSYFLVHFQTEAGFEAFVRDGDLTSPVYGARLDFTGDTPENDQNLVNKSVSVAPPLGPAPDYGYVASAYHTLRKSVVLDATDVDPGLTLDTGEFVWDSASQDVVVSVSGVHYFVPNTAGGVSNFTLTDLSFDIDPGLFADTYCTEEVALTGGAAPALPTSFCPVLVSLHAFSNSVTSGDPTFTQTLVGAEYTGQGRIGLEVALLSSAAPDPANKATLAYGDGVVFLGDDLFPSFSSDAGVQIYCRRPRGNTSVANSALPYSATDGPGFVLAPNPATTILMHTTTRHASMTTRFGNFLTGAAPAPALASLVFAQKDYEERFLDEVYRYRNTFNALTSAENAALNGPGLGAWIPSGIEIPIRAGTTTGAFDVDSWVQNEDHVSALGGADLQVAGLPRRNPSLSATALAPAPSAGLLLYPQTDYTSGYSPADVTDLSVLTQPDYSGSVNTRIYIRAFDLNKGGTRDYEGQSLVTLRLMGLALEDFEYSGAGYGNATSGIAVLIKVPGLTTYLDLGRLDGSGPSKQSTTQDGAGCRVVGPDTITSAIDPDTGLVYCEIQAFVGPNASFFTNTGVNGSEVGTIPLIVAVIMTANAVGYNMRESYVSPGVFTPGDAPGSVSVRGLFGISIV